MIPSAGKASPGKTRTTSPTINRLTATRSKSPFSFSRSIVLGKRRIKTSKEPAVLSRMRNSIQRPVNRKNTSIVNESKYTSEPHQPLGSKVAAELTKKAIKMPNETGKSILI